MGKQEKIFEILSKLNDRQREALLQIEGPILVIAGAGSGKTRVLTYRIAYLIHQSIAKPEEILAVTFTNKAANEMKQRIKDIVGRRANSIWIHTFHSMGARILRENYDLLGYSKNFVIYDREDQKRLLKNIMKSAGWKFDVGSLIYHIEQFKKYGVMPQDGRIQSVIEEYMDHMKKNNAMDFDDLLANTLKLFESYPQVLDKYAKKFKYIHVDEYQDTSPIQYKLIRRLLKYHDNIFVVGDEDQSIYSFRGADFRIILNFERDFPNAKVVKLEQNYRSTKEILDLANRVIKNNRSRRHKVLWTNNTKGKKPAVLSHYSDREEAAAIVRIIEKSGRPYSDFAILYRVNALSRALEEALMRNGIPYNIVGGFRFYERKEVKDLLAYLRLIYNPRDDMALERIISVPPRGIGSRTLQAFREIAQREGTSIYEAIKGHLDEVARGRKTRQALENFVEIIEDMRGREGNLHEMAQELIDRIGYIEYIQSTEDPGQAQNRLENIQELINSMRGYSSLEEYLESISLASDQDELDTRSGVKLMTIHSAKGLEFPVVFVIGLEENIFPHFLSISENNIEEERRLFYVAVTRAQEELYLSHCERRTFRSEMLQPSRFLEEAGLLDEEEDSYTIREYTYEEEDTGDHPFRIGDIVEHRKFGIGRVMSIDGERVKVLFQREGLKTLVLKYANLKKVS